MTNLLQINMLDTGNDLLIHVVYIAHIQIKHWEISTRMIFNNTYFGGTLSRKAIGISKT